MYQSPVQPVIVTSPIGYRGNEYHKGTDLACKYGQPIDAVADGIVRYAGWSDGGLGNLVEVQHPDGNVSIYGHNSQIYVHKGDYVKAAQRIAACGSTGNSTGSHCHLELRDRNWHVIKPSDVGIQGL